MKKIIALVLVAVMMMAMGSVAFADDKVTITVNRDSTYAGETTEAGREFTWYKVFSATYASSVSTNASGYESDGTATFDNTAKTGIAYTATGDVAAKLGSWVATTYYVEGDTIPDGKAVGDVKVAGHWDAGSTGNLWFDLTPISGSTNYSVSWRPSTTADVDAVQAAATWLIEKGAYETTGSMTFADAKWTATVDKGYYVIKSDVGDNLVAATTDIIINEKNAYPPLEKTQKDEDATGDATADNEVSVAVGDVIDYEVKVTIPKTAKVGDQILVWDKPSSGLTYNNDVEVKSNDGSATVAPGTKGSNYEETGTESNASWNQLITVTEGSQGKDVVFKFSMTVNASALTDSDKKNESGLKYGRDNDFKYESVPDHVEYNTKFAGIHKFDGAATTKDLEGVKFALKEAGVPFNVTKVSGQDYYIPGGSSNEVVTDSNGLIKIRGLDGDKTYTLTETETLPGYNMLESDITLTLHPDTATSTTEGGTTTVTEAYSSVTSKTDTKWGPVENNQGTTLPSTGGIGTTIFYILGGLLVIGAGVVLVSRRRMNVQ